MNRYICVLLACIYASVHGAGASFSHGTSLQEFLSSQEIILCDNGLNQMLVDLYTLESEDIVLGAAIKELADNYKNPHAITYTYLHDYLYASTFLLVQILKTPSLLVVPKSEDIFKDLLLRLVGDFCEFSPSFSNNEKNNLLTMIQNQFFAYIQECFDSCKGDCFMLKQDDWQSYIPYFDKHVQVLSNVVYAIEIIDMITYVFEDYSCGSISIDGAHEHVKKRIEGSSPIAIVQDIQEFSDLHDYLLVYEDLLGKLVGCPFYAYVNQALEPALHIWCRDMMSLSCIATSRSVNSSVSQLKNHLRSIAHQYAQKKAHVCMGLTKESGYVYIAATRAQRKAFDQLRFIRKALQLGKRLIVIFQNTDMLASQRIKAWHEILINDDKQKEEEIRELYRCIKASLAH